VVEGEGYSDKGATSKELLLAHCKALLEYQNGMVAVRPRFNKLIGTLDKDVTSFDDSFDCFRLSLMFWH
jgi:hypothetical protein